MLFVATFLRRLFSMARRIVRKPVVNHNRRNKNIDEKGRLVVRIKDIISYNTSIDEVLRNASFGSILVKPDGRITIRNNAPHKFKEISPYMYAE